ncbi:Occludin/ELL family protein [Cyanobium sp. BA20m-p-22]|nr:Occludin/ELL family protein [Cyanobium sp. BA20m-p-22]
MAGALLVHLLGESAWAGPVVCTTTLEPPLLSGARSGVGASAGELGVASGPVEVTRCGQVQTPPALMEKRFYSFRAPYAPGVSLTNQITDLFGIALGGVDGTRVMGLGFPDQAIVWDGTAVENTYRVLLEQQSGPMPWRTVDVPNGYSGSLGSAGPTQPAPIQPAPIQPGGGWQDGGASYRTPVRGLW